MYAVFALGNESIYQIAVSLYVIGSVAEVLQNCSLSAALSKYIDPVYSSTILYINLLDMLSVLCQKYERVLSNGQLVLQGVNNIVVYRPIIGFCEEDPTIFS